MILTLYGCLTNIAAYQEVVAKTWFQRGQHSKLEITWAIKTEINRKKKKKKKGLRKGME